MRPLTPRERRLAAIALLALAVATVWLAVAAPLVGGFIDRDRTRGELRSTYQRNQRLIGALPTLRATAEAQRTTAPRFAIIAPSEVLAASALKDRLHRLAAESGFAVVATEDLQADAPAGSVKLRADLTLTLAQLYETIRRLQNEDAYVVVDYFSASADRSRIAGSLAPLDVRVELTADWRPSGGRP